MVRMPGESRQRHWNTVYADAPIEERGWYEPTPSTLDLVLDHSVPGGAVIDVGAGDSPLLPILLDHGYADITMLDISDVALDQARRRLSHRCAQVTWVRADVTDWTPNRTWDVWHDRAVLHFLVDDLDREAYVAAARTAVAAGGLLIVATFSPDGPDRCAGLPVRRYGSDELVAAFAPAFEPIEVVNIEPSFATGDQRPYIAAALRRELG